MKILYGIQGTGNGHLSRARAMARHFRQQGADVTYLISGRPAEALFDTADFGNFELRRGLTFSIRQGKLSYPRTALANNLARFVQEILTLNVDRYDLVISDFEPITARAAQIHNRPLICLSHQAAFRYNIPVTGSDPLANAVLRFFTPGSTHIGLHWHHFHQPILPPIIHVRPTAQFTAVDPARILVYLPFEDQASLATLLRPFSSFHFDIHAPGNRQTSASGNLHFHPLSVEGFQENLHRAGSVICNAGFELPSECLHLGKKMLIKPVDGQMEQQSNALTLHRLGLASVMHRLDSQAIRHWLDDHRTQSPQPYPDVAEALVSWILAGRRCQPVQLAQSLWEAMAA